jgi:hypothetical protein
VDEIEIHTAVRRNLNSSQNKWPSETVFQNKH